MKWILSGTLYLLGFIYVGSSLIVLSKSDQWWVRAMDHPRYQLAILGVFLLLVVLFRRERTPLRWISIGLLAVALVLDAYRVLPYTKVWEPEAPLADRNVRKSDLITFFTANVLQRNNQRDELFRLIEQESPDVVFLTEVNEPWVRDMQPLKRTFPHVLEEPRGNTYGLALYSRFPLRDAKVRYLVEKDVPSVHGWIVLPSGQEVEFYGLHPKPPVPHVGDTTERDGELMIVAKEIRKNDRPVIVIGDLNDVAWSHTTRLFRRYSGLLDPRVGRGQFSTWPVKLPFFRFPLDHVFHSPSLGLERIEILEKIGSDHFPLVASFAVLPGQPSSLPRSGEDEAAEAQSAINKAKSE